MRLGRPGGLAAVLGGPGPGGEHSRWHLAVVPIFFVAASLLYTYPLILDLRHFGLVAGGDFYGALGRIGTFGNQFLTDPRGLFDSRFFYPYSNTHAYWAPFWLAGVLVAPGIALTGHVLPVVNLLMLAGFVLSGTLAYLFIRRLTGRIGPSLIGGVVFAFHPNRLDHLGHFTTQMIFLLPLIVWAFYRLYLEQRWRHLLLVVIGLVAQTLLGIYTAFATGCLLFGFLLVLLILRPRLCSASLLLKGAVGVALLAAMLFPFLRPYFIVNRELGFARDIEQLQVASMDLLALFDGGSFNALYRHWPVAIQGVEGGLFSGFLVLALAAVAPCLARRSVDEPGLEDSRRRARMIVGIVAVTCLALLAVIPGSGGLRLTIGSVPLLSLTRITGPILLLLAMLLVWVGLEGHQGSRTPLSFREWTVALVFMAAAMYALTLSPGVTVLGHVWGRGPAWWIYHYLPGGRGFGAPGRWAAPFFLVIAVLAALGAWAVAGALRGWAARLAPWLLLAGIMVEIRPRPIPYAQIPDPPPLYAWLAAQPGDTPILELPVDNGRLQSLYMYRAVIHAKRLVNGELSFVPPMLHELAAVTRPLNLPALLEMVRSTYPLGYLIVHGNELDPKDRLRWDAIRATPVPGLRFMRNFDGDDVYALEPTPHAGVEVRRHFSLDVVRRRPVAEFDVRLVGADPEVSRSVEVWFNERLLQQFDSGSGTVLLGPPYREGDRNTIRFVHRYQVPRESVAQEAYRIGRTGRYAPVDIEALSAGKFDGDVVSIQVNGLEEVVLPRRGYNMVALAAGTGRVVGSATFDTFRAASESGRMARFVDGLSDGTVVVAAVKHDGGGALTEAGVQALRSIGAAEDLRGTLWLSHLVVGVKGAPPGQAWEAAGRRELRATIGRARPLALTLEQFALRAPGGR